MAEEIDSRMEQIRLKNEELEKKHKEILEDELEAKKQGAIVSLKESAASAESKHGYDDLELDFDVKDEEKQHSKNPNYKPKSESFIFFFLHFAVHTSIQMSSYSLNKLFHVFLSIHYFNRGCRCT